MIACTGEVRLCRIVCVVVIETGDFSEVTQIVLAFEYLIGLVAVQVVVGVIVVLVTNECVNRMNSISVVPCQLLLERVVLVTVVLAFATTIVTLTVTDNG